MNRLERLRRRIANSPKNVRFADLDNLLQSYGFEGRPGKGSHYYYRRGSQRIVVPFRRPYVLPIYVRLALKAIARAELEDDESGHSE
jgi:predicted RNA binding protein YcfA (HicA-like mRNA interferase family)